jgi:hypothetical protein
MEASAMPAPARPSALDDPVFTVREVVAITDTSRQAVYGNPELVLAAERRPNGKGWRWRRSALVALFGEDRVAAVIPPGQWLSTSRMAALLDMSPRRLVRTGAPHWRIPGTAKRPDLRWDVDAVKSYLIERGRAYATPDTPTPEES